MKIKLISFLLITLICFAFIQETSFNGYWETKREVNGPGGPDTYGLFFKGNDIQVFMIKNDTLVNKDDSLTLHFKNINNTLLFQVPNEDEADSCRFEFRGKDSLIFLSPTDSSDFEVFIRKPFPF